MTTQTLENTPVSSQVATDALIGEVGFWPGVEVREQRLGRHVFHLGRRQLGHLHAEVGGECLADIPVASGWVTVSIRTVADLRDAVGVLRHSYERAVHTTTSI